MENVSKAPNAKKAKLVIIVVVIAILAIVAYNLPYCKDGRAYDKVCEENTLSACSDFLNEYPDGRHADDVMFLKIGLQEETKYKLKDIIEYFGKFPDGKHIHHVEALYDNIWDAEIARYDKRDKANESSEAVRFMEEMLRYMREKRLNSVLVNVNSDTRLKDYEEYDADVREVLELFADGNLSIAQNMVSLKKNFTSSDVSALSDILVEGAEKAFDKMFTPGFIDVVNGETFHLFNDESNEEAMPKLTFDYVISSQEDKIGDATVPHIWSYTDGSGNVLNYLVGITVDFAAHFSIPSSNVTYDYAGKGEPEKNLSDVEDIKDGYRKMTATCFVQFSNQMSQNMGLAEAYTAGEAEEE